jgi:hypothetical protein
MAKASAGVIFERSIISQIRIKPGLMSCDLEQFVRNFAQPKRAISYLDRNIEQADYCRSWPG